MKALADASQRRLALDPAKNFHLEAPAGSGKTFLLAARFLRLVGIVSNPQQILALTFTKKAAGEMRERITGYLARAKRGDAGESEADREMLGLASNALLRHKDIERMLIGGDLLRIQTFHSFCHAVISQAPLEAGIPPGSVLMEDNDQDILLRQIIDEALGEISGRNPEDPARSALENRLLYLNNSWRALSGELRDLMNRREALSELVAVLNREQASEYLLQRTRDLSESELSALKAEFERCALGLAWRDFIAHLESRRAGAADVLPPHIPSAAWEDLPQWSAIANALLTKGGAPRQQAGEKAGFYSGFAKTEWLRMIHNLPPLVVERLGNIRELPHMESATGNLDSLFDLILLLHAVLDAYETRCRSTRRLDFAKLELAALHLFDSTAPSDLQLVLDHQIRHILVDEFQDTSRVQWDFLRRLCAGWLEGDGRTLFLVGDPKQSIYSFRKAEVSLFRDAKEGLPIEDGRVLPLHPLVLETNFRSQPKLIGWCNALFGDTVMENPRPEHDEVEFAPSAPAPREDWPARLPSPELVLFCDWPDAAAARRREADWLAAEVSRRVRDEAPQGEIGVLLFTRTHLPVYLEALQRRKIPVQVKEGIKLFERPEVRYLWQLCRALVFPQDHLAWAGQLRSPWLCLDFDEVYAVCCSEQKEWVEKIRTHAEKSDAVSAFWEKLRKAWPSLAHEPLADVAERAWIELGGAQKIAGLWGSRGINCCLRFFDLLRRAEVGEPVRTLMRAEELLDSAYEPVDPDAASSSVFVMTVHGAKGLEFDTVFIPFMDYAPVSRERRESPPYVLERIPGSGEHLLAVRPDRLTGERDALYSWLRGLQGDRRFGEAKRLFYVAATRAKRELLMSGVLRGGKAGFSFVEKTPLDWLNKHYALAEAIALEEMTSTGPGAEEPSPEWKKRWHSEGDDFTVRIEPDAPEPEAFPAELPVAIPMNPAEFERERAPFSILHPSALAAGGAEKAEAEPTGSIGAPVPCKPELWGILIHRLLAAHGTDGVLPSLPKIASWLARERMSATEAAEVARQAVSEVEACLADEWLQELYFAPAEDRFVEWPVESVHAEHALYSGVIDLAVCVRGKWKLLDFKTSRPAAGEPLAAFSRRELEKYGPQLAAYKEMWARLKGIDEDDIDTFLYWTALRKGLPSS